MTTQANVPAIDLGAEGGIGVWEWGLIAVVAIAATIYLIRKFTTRKSGCAGCGKDGCAAVKPEAGKP